MNEMSKEEKINNVIAEIEGSADDIVYGINDVINNKYLDSKKCYEDIKRLQETIRSFEILKKNREILKSMNVELELKEEYARESFKDIYKKQNKISVNLHRNYWELGESEGDIIDNIINILKENVDKYIENLKDLTGLSIEEYKIKKEIDDLKREISERDATIKCKIEEIVRLEEEISKLKEKYSEKEEDEEDEEDY